MFVGCAWGYCCFRQKNTRLVACVVKVGRNFRPVDMSRCRVECPRERTDISSVDKEELERLMTEE